MAQTKVLYVTTTYPTEDTKSTGFFVTNVISGIDKTQTEVSVLTLSHTRKSKKYVDSFGVKVIQLPYTFLFKPLLGKSSLVDSVKRNFFSTFQIVSFMLNFALYLIFNGRKYDVIHAHWIVTSGFVAVLTKPFHGRPVVITAHGADFHLPKNFILKAILKFCYVFADHFIFVSKNLRNIGEQAYGMLPKNNSIIYNCVQTDEFKPDYEKRNEKFTFVNVARLSDIKRQIDILKAVKRLRDAGSSNFKVLLIGEGPERKNLEQYIVKHDLSKFVELLGYIDNTELPSVLQKAHVFVTASIKEGFATTNVEAQAVGLPIISGIGVGTEELIHDGENGFFFNQKNIDELVSIMQYCIDNPSRIQKMSVASRERAVQGFSARVVGSQHSELYKRQRLQRRTSSQAIMPTVIQSTAFGLTFAYLSVVIIDEIFKNVISRVLNTDILFIGAFAFILLALVVTGQESLPKRKQKTDSVIKELANVLVFFMLAAGIQLAFFSQIQEYGVMGVVLSVLLAILTFMFLKFT